MLRIRDDKPLHEADTLPGLRAWMQRPLAAPGLPEEGGPG
jgi:hypothetical protein